MGGLSFTNTMPMIHQQIFVADPTILLLLALYWPNKALLIGKAETEHTHTDHCVGYNETAIAFSSVVPVFCECCHIATK